MTAFNDHDCHLLKRAFDYAWELFLKQKRLTTANVHLAEGAIAYALIEAAQHGERNARMLAKAAVACVEKHERSLTALRVPIRAKT